MILAPNAVVSFNRVVGARSGAPRVETSIDVHPATPEHYIVPPGTDLETALPPAPTSA